MADTPHDRSGVAPKTAKDAVHRPGRGLADTQANTPESPTTGGPDGVRPREIGGQLGPEPTRYGDWEKNGRCTDF